MTDEAHINGEIGVFGETLDRLQDVFEEEGEEEAQEEEAEVPEEERHTYD